MYEAFTKQTEQTIRNWLKGFPSEYLRNQIETTEDLLSMELFRHSLLSDYGHDLLEMLYDECVRRVTGIEYVAEEKELSLTQDPQEAF